MLKPTNRRKTNGIADAGGTSLDSLFEHTRKTSTWVGLSASFFATCSHVEKGERSRCIDFVSRNHPLCHPLKPPNPKYVLPCIFFFSDPVAFQSNSVCVGLASWWRLETGDC